MAFSELQLVRYGCMTFCSFNSSILLKEKEPQVACYYKNKTDKTK